MHRASLDSRLKHGVRHALSWGDHRAMRHKRFRYWAFNTMLRMRAGQMRHVYYRQQPKDRDLTSEMLANKEARRALVKRMVVVTQDIPGTLGERMGMRADLERMVDQIEAETAAAGINNGKGRLPSFFLTFTCAVYKWHQLHEMLERLMTPEQLQGRKPFSELSEEERRSRFPRFI